MMKKAELNLTEKKLKILDFFKFCSIRKPIFLTLLVFSVASCNSGETTRSVSKIAIGETGLQFSIPERWRLVDWNNSGNFNTASSNFGYGIYKGEREIGMMEKSIYSPDIFTNLGEALFDSSKKECLMIPDSFSLNSSFIVKREKDIYFVKKINFDNYVGFLAVPMGFSNKYLLQIDNVGSEGGRPHRFFVSIKCNSTEILSEFFCFIGGIGNGGNR